jgi:single-stranded-DNA-specific exonuclease
MDGDHGKASSRSYGGFNLFTALSSLSPLLESYGGHELAAGFTISRENIDTFREKISALAEEFYAELDERTTIDIDCAITAELLTVPGIDSLNSLEPTGNGCPKPVLMMERLQVERINVVGNGRHMRLRLRQGRWGLNAICFSCTPDSASIQQGDLVDVAFVPQSTNSVGNAVYN